MSYVNYMSYLIYENYAFTCFMNYSKSLKNA